MAPASDSDDAARSDEGLSEAAPLSGVDDRFGFTGVGLVADDAWAELPPGTVLGDVTIVRRIDAGGMGCVYEGRQHAPDRPVAVKVMHRGLLGGGLRRRFAAEAEILARLKHPHIAQIHSFGTHRDAHGPLPFFVMELVVDGRPLTRFAAERGLDPRRRVALFEQVCGAVAHGHQRGVVHRDLKPGNILVDAAGEPKVIDFGVARATDTDRAGTTTTGSGVVGTLRYMSPEQLGIGGDGVDTRSDVYALGLVLHELLLGELPYDLGGRSPVAAAALLSGRDGTPAADVERGLRARGGLPRRAAARLAVIVAACLHVDPARRYGTAVELRAELGRWLAGEPLVVKPPTLAESLGRFAARHRAATAAVAATALALAIAVTGIGWFSLRAERQRHSAEAARAVAEARGAEAERRAADARRELHRSRVLLAAAARERGAVAEARRLLEAARDAEPAAARSIEIACLAADLDGSVAALEAGGGAVTAVAWSADGRMLAAGTAQGDVRCWRWPALDAPGPVWSGRHDGEVWGAAFAPDGTRLATVSADGTVRIWSAAGAPDRVLTGHEGPVYGVAWSPDGDRLATTGRDGTVRLWDAGTGTEAGRFSGAGGTVFAAAFAPDGMHLASGSRDGVVRIWDVGSGTLRGEFRGHAGRVFAIVYAADGTLASASEDGTVHVRERNADRPRLVLRHSLRVNGVAFTAAGESIVTAAGDGVLRTWDAADGGETARLVGHEGACWSVATRPQGLLVASGAADGSVRVWNLDPQAAPWRRESERVTALVRLPGRGMLAVATADGRVRLRDADTLSEHCVLAAAGGSGVRALACSADGGTLAVAADDGGVTLWDVAGRRVSGTRRPHERRIYAVAFSPCGRRLLTAAEDRTARVTDVASDEAVGPALRHPRRVLGAAWSPDGARVATACEDRLVRLWDAMTGALLAEWQGHTGPVNWVTFSADGGRVASAASDASVRIWDAAGREPPRVLTGPARQVWKVAFAPDGKRVAAAAADGTVPIWEAADGQPVATLRGHADQVWAVDFAPDGRSLATGSWDGCVRLWGVSAREIARREAGAGDDARETTPDAAAWDQFRGPSADGSTGADLPLEWSEDRHVRWKTPLPGKAWSSPVAAEGRIWLSNATEDGRRLSAVCVDAADGRVLHDVTVFEIAEPAICDPYNSHASPTPVLVEGRLFVHFGSAGTACLDAATGAVLWRRQDLPCNHHRGPGSSPIPWRDRLFVNFDGFDRQYVVALAIDDGRTLWRTDRDIDYGSDDGDMKKAYGTPALVEHDGRVDLVSPAAVATVAYDPETGVERWKAYHGGYNAAARPLFAAGLVIVTTAGGDNVVAIRPGGRGDVTRTHVAWKFRKSAPTRPSQAVVGDHLYLVSDNGVFSCVALADGAVAWQQRRSGRHSASPVRSGDRLYWCDEDGTTVVTRANPERFELLAENRLEAGCMASPAVVGTDLVLRTKTHLYRIGSDGP